VTHELVAVQLQQCLTPNAREPSRTSRPLFCEHVAHEEGADDKSHESCDVHLWIGPHLVPHWTARGHKLVENVRDQPHLVPPRYLTRRPRNRWTRFNLIYYTPVYCVAHVNQIYHTFNGNKSERTRTSTSFRSEAD